MNLPQLVKLLKDNKLVVSIGERIIIFKAEMLWTKGNQPIDAVFLDQSLLMAPEYISQEDIERVYKELIKRL